jgi:hypothetical protein
LGNPAVRHLASVAQSQASVIRAAPFTNIA